MTQPSAPSDPPRRSVVTGGAGFIGSHLVDRLVDLGDDVWVVDDLSTGQSSRLNPAAQFSQVDVADDAALSAVVEQAGPVDLWFHLAAQADVRVSVEEPLRDARTNVLGTVNVLEQARKHNARVIFTSTGGAIYGDAPPPTPEGTREAPLSPYGAAKLAAEKYVETSARLYALGHVILRFANVYGPRQDPHGEAGVVAIFGGKLLTGDGVTIYGDGQQTRDYVYVGDVVEACLAAADSEPLAGEAPIYNIGTGTETTVNELWATMQQAAGVELASSHATLRPGELLRSALDASRAREHLGVGLGTPLAEGLSETLRWMRSVQ